MKICGVSRVNLLGRVPFPSSCWLYLKTYGPCVDRGLSVVTREGRAICLLVRLYLHKVSTVNNYLRVVYISTREFSPFGMKQCRRCIQSNSKPSQMSVVELLAVGWWTKSRMWISTSPIPWCPLLLKCLC